MGIIVLMCNKVGGYQDVLATLETGSYVYSMYIKRPVYLGIIIQLVLSLRKCSKGAD